MLSAKQLAQYDEQGYIIVPGVLDEFTRKRMQSVLAGLVEKSRAVSTHNDIYDLEPNHSSEEPRVRRIKRPHVVDPVFNEFTRSTSLLSILAALLGNNVRLHGSKLNLKAPQFGSPVEWHQDWAFYPHTNDDLLAVGVMLDDTTVENGAMYVMPGTHKGPTFNHHGADGLFCGAIDPDTSGLDFSGAVPCEGAAGSCSFHHVRLVHGSAQNTSEKPRQLLLYECTAADAWPLVNFKDLDEFNSRMISGEPTLEPRTEKVPIRMPLPPALAQGSIYENQTALRNRFFDIKAAAT